jgi:hypothetical protein
MITQNQQPNQALPEVIRVRAQRGFRGPIDGKFSIASPGDVVEVPRALAMELRGAGKAVMTDEDLKRQAGYLPERKKGGKAADPATLQLKALTDAVTALQKLVTGLVPPAKA